MTVKSSVVSSVTSARSEVKVTAPVSPFRAKYGELPVQKLQQREEKVLVESWMEQNQFRIEFSVSSFYFSNIDLCRCCDGANL